MKKDHPSIITLTTDFGLTDTYVGEMKGVIFQINPQAQIIDITHNIPPQDLSSAAFQINNAYQYFPEGSIHIIVIDPSVGSQRRSIVCQTEKAIFVCPDNGICTKIFEQEKLTRTIEITNPNFCLRQISRTFHGRDVFAPVAAHISCGVSLTDLGPEISDITRLSIPQPKITDNEIIGKIIWIDNFGNAITNVSMETLKSTSFDTKCTIQIAGIEIDHLSSFYDESGIGSTLALVNSSGNIEIAVNQGSASSTLNIKVGEKILFLKTLPS
ncbi:MAG: SAM-dependent chlorinase/fluorinase [Candidatus Poribacteria bacterium]|nr:SAM-dependent chlorinase/fluorinase [Candidatus Poribacteria bacterium]